MTFNEQPAHYTQKLALGTVEWSCHRMSTNQAMATLCVEAHWITPFRSSQPFPHLILLQIFYFAEVNFYFLYQNQQVNCILELFPPFFCLIFVLQPI